MVDLYLYHYHKCSSCGKVWSHDPLSPFFKNGLTEHTCECGHVQYSRHIPTFDELETADEAYKEKVQVAIENEDY